MMHPAHARRIALILLLVFSFQNAIASMIAGGDQLRTAHPQHDPASLDSPSGHHDHALHAGRPDSSDIAAVTSSFRCDGDPLCSCCAGDCIPALAGIRGVDESLISGAVFLPFTVPQPARLTDALFRPPISR
jgi:hypothetical protein